MMMSYEAEMEELMHDEIVRGPDDPEVSADARARLNQLYASHGLDGVEVDALGLPSQPQPQQIPKSEEELAGYWYLATPYSKYPYGLEQAWREACRVAAHLVSQGIAVYCPIAETHPVAIYGGMDPLDHELWMFADRPKMDGAAGLIVVKMPGWNESKGITEEIRVFEEAGKPIQYLDWVVGPANQMEVFTEKPSFTTECNTQTAAKQETILEEAQRITSGDRQRDYDHPTPNHQRIADLWNAYLGIRRAPMADISPADVASMMILLKLARNVFTPKRDSATDIAGYARCLARIQGFEP